MTEIKPAVRPEAEEVKQKPVKKKAVKKKVKKGAKKKAVKTEGNNPLDKLSPAHREFCYAYVENLGNGTRAYMSAYPNAKESTAAVNASQLLIKANIKQAIQHLYTQIWAKRTEDLEKSKTYTLIHCVGEADIADVIDLEGGTLTVKALADIPEKARKSIQSIDFTEKQTQFGPDRNIKIKMYDKLSALKLRAQIQGILAEDDNKSTVEIVIKPAERPVIEKE